MNSNDRGRKFETDVARFMRSKGITVYRDSRSGAGEVHKADLRAPGIDLHMELKSHAVIKLRDWWEQTESGCPIYKSPALLIDNGAATGRNWAVVRLDTLCDLVRMGIDDAQTITELRTKIKEAQL